MDNYKVIGNLGEGSFGRVYKAKQLSDGSFVALKVISKRGRSTKEIKDLRSECEIQRHLHHPNIIRMLDSFETETEIVVITEFAHQELNVLLGEEGYLPEKKVQMIVWDLVSALYYLHTHRVLHRDLKPQNILLDSKDRAKLCDFGFARNMSTGTHVLTSIKGTPLYMAPELIEAVPYDHNADLWSLGCIIYESLVGAPPFCTASILHLIQLIRFEEIVWPTFLSDDCISFLKGLLQKNPSMRMSWSQILNHPFVKGHILLSSGADATLAKSSSSSSSQKLIKKDNILLKATKSSSKKEDSILNKNSDQSMRLQDIENQDAKNNNQTPTDSPSLDKSLSAKVEKPTLDSTATESANKTTNAEKSKETGHESLKFIEESHPIETEEWIVFLQKTIEEAMNGEMVSLTQVNLANIILSPLRNSNASSKILTYIAKLFSIPFALKGISSGTLQQIKDVYLEIKLVPNLIYASKLLLRMKKLSVCDETPPNMSTSSSEEKVRYDAIITDNILDCLECVFLLIVHLAYLQEEFLVQFCDALVVLNIYDLLHYLLNIHSKNSRVRIVLDLLAILTHILRKLPENYELVENVFLNVPDSSINFTHLLRHEDAALRERGCYFLMFLGKTSEKIMSDVFCGETKETLEALMFDSMENVRNAAEKCVDELKNIELYQHM